MFAQVGDVRDTKTKRWRQQSGGVDNWMRRVGVVVVEFLPGAGVSNCDHLARGRTAFVIRRRLPTCARTTKPFPTTLAPLLPFAMLDTFEVLTTSGVVLWSRTYVPVGANVINSLIRDVFIEERIQPQSEDAGSKPTYKKEGYTLKWTAAKDLGLIFVVSRITTPRGVLGWDGTWRMPAKLHSG